MRKTVQFQDGAGTKLDIVLERTAAGTYIVFALHDGERGATSRIDNERSAIRAWQALEGKAIAAGWKYRTYDGKQTAPGKMTIDVTGQRLFRDRRTGELFRDESSSRPPSMPSRMTEEEIALDALSRVTRTPRVDVVDRFTADNLPAPR